MTATQIMAAITTAKQAEKVIKALITRAANRWPDNALFVKLAAVLPALLILMLAAGCMTYVREIKLADSPVHIEGIRGSVNAQVGIQTRGQHIPGAAEETAQEGGGRADTQATIPVNVDRSTSTPAAAPSAPSAPSREDNATPADTNAAAAQLTFTYGGFDGSKAVLDPKLVISNATFDARGVAYAHTDYPAAWDNTAVACLFVVQPSGPAAGGKFEWAPSDRFARSWDNIRNAYSGGGAAWVEPADGASVLYGLFSADGTLRSNLLPGTWHRQ